MFKLRPMETPDGQPERSVRPTRPISPPPLSALAFALASAALLLFQLGYAFEAGDQLQYLLLPYRELLPEFLPGDWFTWQTSHYHQTFSWIVRGVWALGDTAAFPRGMLVAHLLNLAAFGFAIWRLSIALSLALFEASFAMLMFAGVRQIGLAGAVVDHAALVPADLALGPFLLACAALCERRWVAMGAWLGVSGFMHANYAVLGPLVLFPLALLQSLPRPPLRQLLLAAAVFGLIAAPTLWLVLTSFVAHDPAPAAVAVTLFVRSPHHYDLASMRPDEFYFAALLGLLALPGLAAPALRAHRQLTAAMLIALLFGVLGSGLHILPLARLFIWRLSIPLFALLLMAAAATLRRAAQQRDWLVLSWSLGGCAALLTFAQSDPLESSPWTQPGALLAAGLTIGLFALASIGVLLRSRPRALRYLTPLATLLTVAIAWSVVRTPLWQPSGVPLVPPRGLHLLDASIQLEPRVRHLYAMVRERTPPDARFLIPPGQSQFRLQARRAVFVDWKCAPMKGNEALEWQRRMLLAMGAATFPARGYELPRTADALYNARPLADLAALARSQNLTHLLVRGRRNPSPLDIHWLLGDGAYNVYELAQ